MTTYAGKFQELKLIPSDGGRFELSVDGKLVYSKLETGKFPEWDEVKRAVDARL